MQCVYMWVCVSSWLVCLVARPVTAPAADLPYLDSQEFQPILPRLKNSRVAMSFVLYVFSAVGMYCSMCCTRVFVFLLLILLLLLLSNPPDNASNSHPRTLAENSRLFICLTTCLALAHSLTVRYIHVHMYISLCICMFVCVYQLSNCFSTVNLSNWLSNFAQTSEIKQTQDDNVRTRTKVFPVFTASFAVFRSLSLSLCFENFHFSTNSIQQEMSLKLFSVVVLY